MRPRRASAPAAGPARLLHGRARGAAVLSVSVVVVVAVLALLLAGAGPSGGVRVEATDPESELLDGFVAGSAATPDPVVRSLEDLRAIAGEAPGANRGRLRIPAIGVDAPIGERYVGDDGTMIVPEAPDEVVWYDLSAWPSLGGAPGAGGNAVFAAHVDRNGFLSYAGVHYTGPGAFRNLALLSAGSEIEIDWDGETLRYVVEWGRELAVGDTDWGAIFAAGEGDGITLVTCGGDFDLTGGGYSHRVVVHAVRI